MGGDVAMESAPGRGTTLYLTVVLPIADVDDVETGPGLLLRRARPSRDVADEEGSVVLLAEDHPINRRVLVHQLGIIGFHVDTAEDGEQALERFTGGWYGMVLTDLNMPIMDGFELARAIRRHEAENGLPRTPIVALTANVLPEEAATCASAGMDDFAGKPAAMPVIAEKLRRWMPHIEWSGASATAPAAASGSEVAGPEYDGMVDDAVLAELTGGDGQLAAAILIDYVDSSRSDLAALRFALDGAEAEEVRRHPHLAGAARHRRRPRGVTRESCDRAEKPSRGPERRERRTTCPSF